MKPQLFLLRLWPFLLFAGFSWKGWHFQRTAAYARLAELMDISVENCHIGCFNAIQCQRVIDLCNSREIYRARE